MTEKNPFAELFAQNGFAKLMEGQNFPFDMKNFLETQRKNMQAMTQAQQTAIEGFRALAQRQSELLSQMMEDNSGFARSMMGEGTPEEKIAKNAKLFKA